MKLAVGRLCVHEFFIISSRIIYVVYIEQSDATRMNVYLFSQEILSNNTYIASLSFI